jgi:hypothetical protein
MSNTITYSYASPSAIQKQHKAMNFFWRITTKFKKAKPLFLGGAAHRPLHNGQVPGCALQCGGVKIQPVAFQPALLKDPMVTALPTDLLQRNAVN